MTSDSTAQAVGQIEQRIEQDNARRKHYISPATREVAYAQSDDALRRKIEDRVRGTFQSATDKSCMASSPWSSLSTPMAW
jgi:hypothetical protein